ASPAPVAAAPASRWARCGSPGSGAAATPAPRCSTSAATARRCAGRPSAVRCRAWRRCCREAAPPPRGGALMWESLGTVRDLGRLQQIASVLVAYGFGDVVRRIGLAGALERAGRMLHWQDPEALAHMPPPVRVRRALEELGPTFVKLGQMLATRVDLLPPEWTAE